MQHPEDIFPNFTEWPESWKGFDEDVPCGQAILEVMRPFVQDLIAQGLARKTIRRHMGNLWLLGGEIIRELNMSGSYESFLAEEAVKESVGLDGGLSCRHLDTEEEERTYTATCRKLHKFLQSG